jgi:hypothetical protein
MCRSRLHVIRILVLCLIPCVSVCLQSTATASPIVLITGPNDISRPGFGLGGSADQILATQWDSLLAFNDVLITADVAGLGEGTAFLMTKVGPGATAADQVARASFTFPERFGALSHTVPLFTGLSLPAGHYYLVLTGAPTVGVWDTTAFNLATTTLFPCDLSGPRCPVIIPNFPSWQLFGNINNPFPPASNFTPFHFGLGELLFSVTGTVASEPPTPPVPEPASLALLLTAGIVGGIRRLRARGTAVSR